MQLVAPGKDKLRTYVLDVGGLEVVKFHRTVRAIVYSKSIVRSQLDLLKLQVDRLVDPIYELIYARIDRRQYRRLFVYLVLELGE